MTSAANSHTTNNFDLMRLGFASMVLLSHAAEVIYGNRSHEPLTQVLHALSFGDLGVDCFFILSGFMIASSWERDPRWGSFLKKRILRIYPGFIVAYLISTVVVGAIGAVSASTYLAGLCPGLMLRELGLLQLPTTPPTFQGSIDEWVNGPLWSVKYEFSCYLLVMFLGFSGLLASARLITASWLVSLVVFLVFRVHHSSLGPGAVMGGPRESFLRLVPMYWAGIVVYKTEIWKIRLPPLICAATILLVAGMSFYLTAELAVGTVGAYLLFIIGFTPPRRTETWCLPDVSYGVYLYGWPVQKLLLLWWPAGSFIGVFVLSLVCSLIAGSVSWFAVEKPALALKEMRWPVVG